MIERMSTVFYKIKRGLISFLITSPKCIWDRAGALLKKRSPQYWDELSLERYARYLLKNLDKEWERAVDNRRCLVIEKTPFAYSYCNVAVINNMLSMIVYVLYNGCVPVINFNVDKPGYFQWDWFFKQPCEIMGTDVGDFDMKSCDVADCSLRVNMQMVHDPKRWDYKLYKMLYSRFVQFNKETEHYIQNEISEVGDPTQMMGCLIRGTDYITLRPAGHPVQPKPEEIVSKVHGLFESGKYTAVYVATEEEKLYNMVKNVIGGGGSAKQEKVLRCVL